MFRDREDAALKLAQRLRRRVLPDPLVLAIPGGVSSPWRRTAAVVWPGFSWVVSPTRWYEVPGRRCSSIGPWQGLGSSSHQRG
jgi:hypothetical protein